MQKFLGRFGACLWLGALLSCQDSLAQSLVQGSAQIQAFGVNPDFEEDSLDGWTLTSYYNRQGVVVPPMSFADLRLAPGPSVNLTGVHTGNRESLVPAGLDSSTSLRLPKYGSTSAAINELGSSHNVNALAQQITLGPGDVDLFDGQIHLRFVVAPVLRSGGHDPTDQPFYWVSVTNKTRGDTLLIEYNYANSPGVPWKTPNSITFYTDWRAFDVAPGNDRLAIGDEVEVFVLAAGCSQGGHYGEVYVDGFGSFLPGPAVSAHAPANVNEGGPMTYTYNYRNGAASTAQATEVRIALPAYTTFLAVHGPAGCIVPAVGATGEVLCPLGDLPPGAYGSFSLDLQVDAGSAPGSVDHGDYAIRTSNLGDLLGPDVHTTITTAIDYADLEVRLRATQAASLWGQTAQYTASVQNLGPLPVVGAQLTESWPDVFLSSSWSCMASGGATCPAASGTGRLAAALGDLPVSGRLEFSFDAALAAGSDVRQLSHDLRASVPADRHDPDPTNDVAVALCTLADKLANLSISKSGNGSGTVRSVPDGIDCGATCSAAVAQGSTLSLSATPDPGYIFLGWRSPACGVHDNPCQLSIPGDLAIDAEFAHAHFVTGRTVVGRGQVGCQSPVLDGANGGCSLQSYPGYKVLRATDNGVDVTTQLVLDADGSTWHYALSNVLADHELQLVFVGDLAASCVLPNDCGSGFCSDSVCCDQACTEGCASCVQGAQRGTCAPLPSNAPPVPGACNSDFTGSPCVQCDGISMDCVYVPDGTPTADVCGDGYAYQHATCDGSGYLSGHGTTYLSCNLGCADTTCACQLDTDCATGELCRGNICHRVEPQGLACSEDDLCQTGHCVDGVCCDSDCLGQCQACNLTGALGTCGTLGAGAPRGGRPSCTGSDLCAAQCDGSSPSQCGPLPAAETACSDASCVGTRAQAAGQCGRRWPVPAAGRDGLFALPVPGRDLPAGLHRHARLQPQRLLRRWRLPATGRPGSPMQ